MMKAMHWTHFLGLKDTFTLNVNKTFVYYKYPQGMFNLKPAGYNHKQDPFMGRNEHTWQS